MNRRHFLAGAALMAPALATRASFAQSDWPSRPVTMIVPFAPGGSSDVVGRAMAAHMTQTLGKPVVVENRPGAGGEIGARAVIRSPADGYMLMHAPLSTWAINVPLRPKLGYDPVTQLTRVMVTVRTPNVLVVNPQKVPANTLPELIAWLKKTPDASYSTSGIGSSDHLTMEMFKQATGTDAAHVPYNGGAPAVTDLIAGNVQLSFQNLGTITPMIADGRVKPILITSEKRNPLLPNVPTAGEAGLADFVVYSWQALGAPAGLPAPVLEKLHAAAAASLRDRDNAARLAETGFEIVANSPTEFAAFQEGEIARWRRVITAGKITVD